ncbi:hypothetical protein ANCCAN_25415 [Ancylostoma caninum]|uniref:Uncharacterized protein n=1 Tax=Ancylostoma caninum TaxID=29170 RepID=A0A368F9L0_ANCCA|nr:hypothetical protein ANCCAN_25415 [Ancylostoma caninum]
MIQTVRLFGFFLWVRLPASFISFHLRLRLPATSFVSIVIWFILSLSTWSNLWLHLETCWSSSDFGICRCRRIQWRRYSRDSQQTWTNWVSIPHVLLTNWYVQSPYGSLPNGPYYWQPSAGAPYERVSVGGLLL